MASKEFLLWIEQQQRENDVASYGNNKQTVLDQLSEQQTRCDIIANNRSLLDDETKKLSDTEQNAFDCLKSTAEMRLECLKTLSDIDNIEHVFAPLVSEFSMTATQLVASIPDDIKATTNHTQSRILAVGQNWSWISKQLKCTETHLQNAAAYHQFFYDASQFESWMMNDVAKTRSLLNQQTLSRNSHGAVANQLLIEMKACVSTFIQWSKKMNALYERSRHIVPVQLRTLKLETHILVKSLCSYYNKQIGIQEGEELTLTDNSGSELWLVCNDRGQTALVPSVILVIPGPDDTAVHTALQLRLKLLAAWTSEWKRIGKTIIWFLLHVIRQWKPEEVAMLKALGDVDKNDIVAMLNAINKTFAIYWQRYQPYQTLDLRCALLRDIVLDNDYENDKETEFGRLLVIQTAIVIELLARYRDYWQDWELFKVLTETTRHPEYLLVAEDWKDYSFVDITQWLKKWQLETIDDFDMMVGEEQLECSEVERLEMERCLLEREKETAETSHLTTTEREERQTFVITGVIDPRTNEEISFDQATSLGIINQREGRYVNPATGETQPIQMAMNAGKIKVELTTVKKSEEKRKDIGLVTIKTCKESRPFTVKSVVDAVSERKLSVEEAVRAGILDLKKGIYTNKNTREELTLADALDSGLLDVEFESDVSNGDGADEDAVTKTYAVHAVEDVKAKKRLTFKQATDANILDMDQGSYLNTATNELLFIADAIKKGFVKATVIHDVQSLDGTSRIVAVADSAIAMSNFKKMSQPLLAFKSIANANNSTPAQNGHR